VGHQSWDRVVRMIFADNHDTHIVSLWSSDEGAGSESSSSAWEFSMNRPLGMKNSRHILALLPQLPKVGRLCWRLWRDHRVPTALKGMIVAIMFYVLSPIDLVPGFLVPVFGQLDDATLLMLGAYLFIRWSPPEVVAEHMASIGTSFFSKFRPWLLRSAR
jgi:uncharacterized membrane protein YkvA (DUF1232 family)